MVAKSGGWASAGKHARNRWWISATGRCPLIGSSIANTWIRDAIRLSPRARRNSPSRSVTTGSRDDSFDVTYPVSAQTPGITSVRPHVRPVIPASQLHRADARTYSRGCCLLPNVGRNDVASSEVASRSARWSTLRDALSRAEWFRVGVMLAVIVALHLVGWITL